MAQFISLRDSVMRSNPRLDAYAAGRSTTTPVIVLDPRRQSA